MGQKQTAFQSGPGRPRPDRSKGGSAGFEQVHVFGSDAPDQSSGSKQRAGNGYEGLNVDRSDRSGLELDNIDVTALGKRFDFEAFGTVPSGWIRSTVRVPNAFLYAGGDAVVIEKDVDLEAEAAGREEDLVPPVPQRRVLLALPDAAVDMQRAIWLSRRPGFNADAALLCHLRRAKECKAIGSVVFEFDFPHGVPLSDVLESRHLGDGCVQNLARNLFKLVTSLGPKPLRLLGFIDTSMIFLNLEDGLEALVPLGCLLSFAGARAALFLACQRDSDSVLAPELKSALVSKNEVFLNDLERACATDSYAVATVALQAFGQKPTDGKDIQVGVPPLANDMLQKALHHQPDWRLSGEAALSHPWLRE